MMRDRRLPFLALLALVAGLAVGYWQGTAQAPASDSALAVLAPAQSTSNSAFSVLQAFPPDPSQSLVNAAGSQQLYVISDANGAMCEAE